MLVDGSKCLPMNGKPSLKRGVVRSHETFKFWWAPTIPLEWLIVSSAVNLGDGQCGKLLSLGHQFIALTVDICVQHGGHDSLRRAGLSVAAETCQRTEIHYVAEMQINHSKKCKNFHNPLCNDKYHV